MNATTIAKGAALVAVLAFLPCGCTYDYLQHTDRIAYRAGDAVRANLESETINPSKRSMYLTGGLGRNGSVMPAAAVAASTPAAPAAAPATPPASP